MFNLKPIYRQKIVDHFQIVIAIVVAIVTAKNRKKPCERAYGCRGKRTLTFVPCPLRLSSFMVPR